ncbi:hypothetical protein [Brevundimonas vesicularis]|uniref:hypothetical protein n=1 Tax=Brevundimonas vesicularis TaxID=41276 RepID=UPI00384ECCA8
MIKKFVVVASAMLVTACATPYVATPYERSASNVRTITVLDDSAEDQAIAYEVASMGSNFGLIGALVDAGIQAERRAALNRALETASFDGETLFETRLAEKLGSQGYQVKVQKTDAPRGKRDFLVSYPTPEGPVDAYIDVVVTHYGYLSAGAFQPFRPSVGAKVRLVAANDPTKILMDNRIVCNMMNTEGSGAITLSPNPAYEFKNREALLEDPARTAAGIQDALYQVADTAAQLLR